MSSIFFDGSPLITTRSACLPGAIVPMRSDSPRNCAPLAVATWIASTGVNPAPTPRWNPPPPQQLTRPLIAEARDHATHAGRVKPGEQQASRFGELVFEFHFLLERGWPWRRLGIVSPRNRRLVAGPNLVAQHRAPRVRRQRIQHALLHRRPPRHTHLEYRKRGSDGDAVLDQIENHVVCRARLHVQLPVEVQILRRVWALSRFLPWKEFRIDQQSVFKVIDSQSSRFAKSDGTQVSGNSRPSFVRRGGRRRKFRRSNEHVGFEVVDALIEPEVHRARRVVGPGELVHLQCPRAHALKIRPRNVDLGSRCLTGVNLLLKFKIGAWFERACSTNRSPTASQVQSRKT